MYWKIRGFDHSLSFRDVGPNQNGSSLTHYGILGMRWGVRRSPEQLGRVKKGQTLYRTTPNPNEKEEGSTYITYVEPDRDMYRGSFNKQGGFQKYYNLGPNDPMYEFVYKAKKDFKIPSYDEQRDVVNEVMKKDSDRLLKKLCKDLVDDRAREFDARYENYQAKRKKDPSIPYISRKDAQKFDFGDDFKGYKDLTQKYINDWKDLTPDQFFRSASSRFGQQTLIKESVISELKKRGYNAMIDQASVGGRSRNIEGYSPMIVFDRDEMLDKVLSNQISDKTRDLADKRYMNWYNWVNSSNKRKQNW